MKSGIELSPETRRRRAIAKLHCAKRDLRLDDATYRTFLRELTGKESARDLSESELGTVLDALRKKGFRSPRTLEPNQRPSAPQERLALALWGELRRLGAVEDGSERALRHFAARLTGVSAMAWADASQMNRTIEALKQWLKREREKRQAS